MIRKIRNALSSKDGKVILENFLSLSALQLVGIVLPIITLPYVLRTIGFDKYGLIVLSASLITYFQSLTDYSFRITATRDVAIFRGNPKKMNVIYSKVLSIKFLFLVFSYLILGLLILFVPKFNENATIYLLSSLMLIGYAIFPEWFFQGIEKMKYITFLNLGIKVFFTVSVFALIKHKEDYWIYPLLQSSGYIVAGIVGQYIMVKKYKLKFIFLPFDSIFKSIKKNFPIFINQFVPNLYNNTSVFLLGLLTNNMIVGIYNAIMVVVNLSITLLEIISRVFFPYLNRNKDKFISYAKLASVTAVILVLSILCGHKIVFWYLNVNFEYSLTILMILSFGILGYSLYNIFGINYFLVHRKDKIVMWNTLFSSIIGLSLAYPLIGYFGIYGAAINLTFCRWLMGGGLMYQYFRLKGGK